MQGQRSSLSTLSENLSFDHGSTSSDTSLDSQMAWNTSSQNQLPEFRIPSNDTNIQYMHNAEWSLGETSSSNSAQVQVDQNERKPENPWSFRSRATLTLGERQYEPCSNILSFDNIDVNNQTTNGGSFLLQNSSSNVLPQDLNMSSGFEDQEDDDCQIVEPPPYTYTPAGLSNEQMTSGGISSSDLFVDYVPENEDRSLNGRRISCKRKSLEVHVGQSSSGAGSSNTFPNATTQNELVINNESELENPRLSLGVGVTNPPSLTNTERSRRNFRLRINGLHQQNPTSSNAAFSGEGNIGNNDISSSRHSSRLLTLRNRLLSLNPATAEDNGQQHVRRSPQTRWSGASGSRTSRSSSPSAITGERDAAFYEEPAARIISENPIFIPPSGIGSSSHNPTTNWNLAIVRNAASTSEPALGSGSGSGSGSGGINSSGAHRSCPQYPRRLSQIVRRSLLSESGGQNSNLVRPPGSSITSSQETALSSGSDTHGLHAPNSRAAMLERHLEIAFGMPYSRRALAPTSSSEGGRSGIMSEIRHVLDLMRRGEGLRVEDMMMLDHSVFFNMADIQDRHRDMRLDVDNMSYEELLALEERIGNVCTGLREETITNHLKQHKYVVVDTIKTSDHQVETEPCSICREEYNDGEDVGTLECGHDFHKECIKQWLMQKNLCPICKTTGLPTT